MDERPRLGPPTLTRTDLRIRPKAATHHRNRNRNRPCRAQGSPRAKDFATSDRIRDDLIAKGVEVMDGDPLGWDWKLDV